MSLEIRMCARKRCMELFWIDVQKRGGKKRFCCDQHRVSEWVYRSRQRKHLLKIIVCRGKGCRKRVKVFSTHPRREFCSRECYVKENIKFDRKVRFSG